MSPGVPGPPAEAARRRGAWTAVRPELAGFAVATALAVVVVARLADSYAWRLFTDGDSVLTVLITHSWDVGQAQDWALSPVLFLPETALFAALSLLGLGVRATLLVNAVVNVVALYAAIRLVVGRPHVGGAVGRSLAAFGALCGLVLLESASGDVSYRLASEVAMTTRYSATVIASVAVVGLARRAVTTSGRSRTGTLVLVALVGAVSTASNPLFLGWAVVPLVAAALVLLAVRLLAPGPAAVLVATLLGSGLLGMVLRVPLAPWIVARGDDYLRPGLWRSSLARYGRLVADTASTPSGAAWVVLVVAGWVVALVAAVLAVRRRDLAPALVALCAGAAPVVALAGAVVTGSETPRYLQPWAFLPVLALTTLPLPRPWARVAGPRGWPVAAALVVVVAAAVALPRAVVAAATPDADLRCVTDWVDASGRTGAGQFWTARAPKAYAADPRSIVQVDEHLNVYTWLTNRADRRDAEITFLVVDDRSAPYTLPAGVSVDDARRVACGRYTILDFSPVVLPLGVSWP